MRSVSAAGEEPETSAGEGVPAQAGRQTPPLSLVLTAFAALYLVWGSTYLGVGIAVQSIPPFLMAGSRFVLAGTLLYAVMRWRGAPRPNGRQWGAAAIIGALLLVIGNGGVTWAQQYVPSGIAALMVAAVPAWIALSDWLRPGGRRPTLPVVAGVAMGFAGIAFLVSGKNPSGAQLVHPWGAVALVASTVAWAIGSIYARHAPMPRHTLLAVAMQMMAGGGLQLLVGVARGEAQQFSPAAITPASGWAWVYLTLIGSLVGFTAYAWLLQVSTPARVSTYAYVNPLIAVLLGHVILKEPVPAGVAVAGALILGAVVLLTAFTKRT